MVLRTVTPGQGLDTQLCSNRVVETDAPDAPDTQKMNVLRMKATWDEIQEHPNVGNWIL